MANNSEYPATRAELVQLLSAWPAETDTIEYREWPCDNKGSGPVAQRIARTLVAFANSVGGAIYVGISEKNAMPVERLKGVHKSVDIGKLIEDQMGTVEPPVRFQMQSALPLENEMFVHILVVKKSSAAPHSIRTDSRRSYPCRRNGSIDDISPSEMRDLVLVNYDRHAKARLLVSYLVHLRNTVLELRDGWSYSNAVLRENRVPLGRFDGVGIARAVADLMPDFPEQEKLATLMHNLQRGIEHYNFGVDMIIMHVAPTLNDPYVKDARLRTNADKISMFVRDIATWLPPHDIEMATKWLCDCFALPVPQWKNVGELVGQAWKPLS